MVRKGISSGLPCLNMRKQVYNHFDILQEMMYGDISRKHSEVCLADRRPKSVSFKLAHEGCQPKCNYLLFTIRGYQGL